MKTTHSQPWFLGVDLGTGSCKTVVTSQGGEVLGFGASKYRAKDVDAKWQEQDPRAILEGMILSVREAISQSGVSNPDCGGMSLGGALHNILAIGHDNAPITGVFTWADTRCSPQVNRIKQSSIGKEIYQRTGCPVHTIYGLYKIIWLKETNPTIYHQAAKFISAKEFILRQLTGEYIVDYSLASGNSLLNIHNLNYDPLVLELAGIAEEQLSELFPPQKTFSNIDPSIADQLEIPESTPLTLGTSDAANSSLGAGAINPTQATLSVGTSGAYRVISPTPLLDPDGRSWCYAMDKTHWLVGGAVNNAGFAFTWWRDALNNILPSESELSYNEIIEKIEETPPGADGLICLPFFTGERSPYWNPNARGVIFSLGLEHDQRHISRSILEGVAFSFNSLGEILTSMDFDIREIRASGGFTKSPVWLQIMANAFNRPIRVPEWGETAAFGASLWAMLSAGEIDSIEQGAKLSTLGDTYEPTPPTVKIYEQMYKKFKRLYQSLLDEFEE